MTPNSELSNEPYRLEVESRPEYLYIRVENKHPRLEISRKILREMAAEMKKSQHGKVLIEMDVEETLSEADNFWLISEFDELDLYPFTIAVVDPKPEHQPVYKFADTAAYNRGFTIRSFTSVEEAEEWLL